MTDQKVRIFIVKSKYSNSTMSSMINYGDDYGEAYKATDYIVANTSEEAIEIVKNKYIQRIEDHNAKVRKIKEKEKELGRKLSRKEMFWEGLLAFAPNIPCDEDNWKAEELKVKGYTIILEKIPDNEL